MNEKPIKIMIVEDEPVIRSDISSKVKKTFGEGDFEIIEAGNGKSALSLMDKSVAVVLTDISMPVMDGIELIKLLRQDYPQTIIVVISGFDDFKNVKTAMQLGAIDYILKPVNDDIIANLMTSIHNLLGDLKKTDNDNDLARLISSNNSSQGEYHEFLLNLGNLHLHSTDKDSERKYYDQLVSRTFTDKVNSHFELASDIKFILEPIENRILVLISGLSNEDFIRSVNDLFSDLKTFFFPTPVSIVFDENSHSPNDVYICTHKIRNMIDSNLIACRSSLFKNDSIISFTKRSSLNMLKARLIQLIEAEEYGKCKSEFVTYFSRPSYSAMPQLILESILCDAVFLSSESFANKLSQEDINTLNEGIYNICSFEENYDILLLKAATLLCDFYSKTGSVSESGDAVVNYLISYFQEHFNSSFSLEEYADKYSFNSTYLIRLFRSKTGTTPNKYIINLRIKEAKRMLENNPELTVKQISELCGYDDQHYFSRLFKAQCGINPTAYRERQKS